MALVPGDKLSHEQPTSLWLIKPFLPREGIVLIYGKKGVGKSPLTWTMAESVATGQEWLGHSVDTTGSVLYIEADTPRGMIEPRMAQVIHSGQVSCYFPPGQLSDEQGLARLQNETKHLAPPALVILNTLRKAHIAKDTDSQVPSIVYGRYRTLFPTSCLAFTHHEKKSPANPDHAFTQGEEFSGSLAWANDAQVVMRLSRRTGRPSKEGMETILTMSGNQLAAVPENPTVFYLKDGLITK